MQANRLQAQYRKQIKAQDDRWREQQLRIFREALYRRGKTLDEIEALVRELKQRLKDNPW